MRRQHVLYFLGTCLLISAATGLAQTQQGVLVDHTPGKRLSDVEVAQLARELSMARRSNDIDRVRRLEPLLWNSLPAAPADGEISARSEVQDNVQRNAAAPLWNDDVLIYGGAVYADDRRPLALAADTLGGIYVAMNVLYHDTSSQIRVYRSTDGGEDWSLINAFWASSGRPIHSFDMCVGDSLGGEFLLCFVFAVQFDDTYWHGGKLYWCSMHADGSARRISIIANADSTHLFGNPSICTDADKFSPGTTYHYIVSEYNGIPSSTTWRGLYITHTTNWGKSWVDPDTSIKNILVETPDMAVDWTTMPESLCVAYHHQGMTTHHISVARNSVARTAPWGITPMADDGYATEPCVAIDPTNGNALVSYTADWGVRYIYSSDLFATYTRDSIDLSGNPSGATVSCSPWMGTSVWRTAYFSHDNGGTIYFKSMQNRMAGFYAAPATTVSQFRPSGISTVIVGQDRDIGGTVYRGNCVYVGDGEQNVYFDASDFPLSVREQEKTPAGYALMQNFPNPFNPKTIVRYSIGGVRDQGSGVSEVRLTVYDVLGREVAVLVNDKRAPGTYEVEFDGARLASGVYFCKLASGTFTATKSMVLVK